MASANPFASTSSATANGLAAPQTVSSPLADPTTSLWEALNLPVPESIASHHNSQRIVLLGRPLSGKRSLCRRLRLAAEAQNSATAGADGAAAGGVGLNGRAGGGGGGAGSGEYGDGDADSFTRRPLFHPTAEEEACADTGAGGEGDMGSPLMSSLMSEGMVERSTSPRAASTTPTAGGAATSASLGATGVGASGAAVAGGMRGMSGAMSTTSHGAGLVHDYVTLRVPSQARSAGLGGVQLSGGTTTTTTNLFGRAVGAASRRVVEFFVCETAGALSMALPTLRSLEEAVVLVVVDVSRPAEIGDQLDRYYDMLQAHTTAVLRAALPHQDEVRRLQMMTARQQYWEAEEQRLLALRAHLAKDRNGEALVDPSVAFEAVNAAAVRLPQHATCPLDTLLVCTKVDLLDRLSKSYANRLLESASAPAGAGAIGEEEEAQLNHLLTPSLRAAMRQSKCTLLALVAQLLRQYAMLRRSALAAVSSRVNTIAGGGGSGAGGNGGGVGSELGKAGSALGRSSSSATTSTAVGVGPTMAVNPFFKALWAFVSCLLLSPPPSSSSSSSAAAAASGGRKEGSGAGGAGGGGRASSPVPSSPIGGASAVPLPDTVTHHCSANLYPSALLPHGLDSFGLLNQIGRAHV